MNLKNIIGVLLLGGVSFGESPVRVACVGDSITFGARIENRENKSYPAQLGQMLGDGYVVENFGVNGATLLKKGNKPYWKTKQFGPAHTFNPDLVIIKLGTNDSKPDNWKHKNEYVADYRALIESFRALPGKPVVYICYPVPVYPGGKKIADKVVREGVIPQIDEVARQTHVEIIDLYAALSNKADLFPDTIHPNAEGARIMAEIIINSCFKRKILPAKIQLKSAYTHPLDCGSPSDQPPMAGSRK
ncbi:MAG: GDSL-type esterase/lipase family protein [Pontiella sp.]